MDDEPSIAPAKGLEKLRTDKKPTRSAEGNIRYMIQLRENVVKNNKKNSKDLPAAIPVTDKRAEKDARSWHRPEMRHLVSKLEKEYGFTAVAMTSWIGSTITADLSEETAAAIARNDAVYEVVPQYEEDRAKFSATPWFDSTIGGETIPLGRSAMGISPSDTSTTSVPIYIVDRTPNTHADLSTNLVPTVNSPGQFNDRDHGTFVTGIISANMNGAFLRGMNPGASNVFNIEIGGKSPFEMQQAFDWSIAHSESTNTYGVINFSLNGSNIFRYDQAAGAMVKRASNRSLVVQSAGNNYQSACTYAYCSALAHNYFDEPTKTGQCAFIWGSDRSSSCGLRQRPT